MDRPPFDPMAYKAIGAALGAIAGLIYIKPGSIRDALGRATVSGICGISFYFVPLSVFGWEFSEDHVLGGAVLMAFSAWPLAGIALKWISAKGDK